MKVNHYQELKQSAIADDVIELNFHSAEGYNGFTKFVSLCDLKDKRQGRQVCNSELNHRYSHLYQGYWYANSWYPLTNSVDMSQIKPDFPLLQLITQKNSELRTQNSELRTSIATPALLRNHPDKRYLPQEQGYLWGTRQTIISMAKALNIPHKLPLDKNGHWHLEAISAMSPLEKYLWCLENDAFDIFAFNSIKYETPTGSGTPFIYLNIPIRVLEEIATEYDLTLPDSYKTWQVGDKWEWIKNHPQIPLFITEGIKKAASLISHGKIAIACFSITTHSEKATENKSSWVTNLKPELLWILQGQKANRLIYLVFDAADVKESSRQAVKRETKKIAKKLKKYGIVKIITWEDESCKGIDDFIAKHGIKGLNKIIDRATNFNKLWEKEIANFGRQLTPNIIINQRYLSADLISQARRKGVKLLCVKSQQNSGKSYSYAESLKQERNLSKNNIENEIKQDLYEQNNSHKSPTINQNNQSLGVDPNNQLSNTNLNHQSLNHYQSSGINQNHQFGNVNQNTQPSSINQNTQPSNHNQNYELGNINHNNPPFNHHQSSSINENNQELSINYNNQLVNITDNNQSSNNNHLPSAIRPLPSSTNLFPSAIHLQLSLGEKVKIKVGSNIYDSIIVGYNCQTQKYQCKFNTGFIERDLSQIIHSKSSLLPDKLITYALTHRQSLAWNLADKFQLDCYLSNVINFENNGIVACADSALLIPEHQEFNDMVIDEAEQVSWHLLASLTEISKNRITKIVRIGNHGKMVIQANGMITIFDADLSDIGVKFYQFLFDISPEDTLVVENIYKPFENIRDCYIYDNVESLRSQIIEAIRDNKRIIIHTSGQKESSTHGTINIEKEILEIFPELESKIYRLDKESLGDSTHLSYQILSDLDRLKEAQIVIASSSINTGVSLDEEIVGTFDGVFGIFYGNFPLTDFEQAIERYRGDCLRHIYIKNGSSERINIGSYKYSDLLNNIMGQTNNIQKLLQDDFNCDLAMDLVKYYCKFAARINNDYIHLKSNFISHLEDKGYTILDGNKLNKCEVKELKEIYQSIRDESENNFQDKVLEKEIPTETRLEELEKSKTKTKEENIEQYKGQLAKKYRTNKITRELIGLDREGYYPQLLLRFWLSVGVDMVMKRDKRVLAKYAQKNDNQGYAIDFNRQSHSTQTVLLHHIGLDKIIDNILNIQSQEILILLLSMQVNPIWFKCIDINKLGGLITETDVIPYLSSLKDSPMIKTAFKQVLDIDLDKNHSPIQLLRMILRRIGYNIKKGSRLGSRSDRKRYYYITSCISNELADEIFTNWLYHELLENDNFENEQKQVA
ncbi:plasmid replication protein, CyRepA1 family [Geminocystis sp.]|uniref:plasmid replication protein, CyRepA1 family n=1 Tax=Geminocystis sp. TaxID=2664100 RepID=UPI003593D8C2